MKWVDDGAYGSNDTGEWNGMLGEIIENVRLICFLMLLIIIATESGPRNCGPHHQLPEVRRSGLLHALYEARHRYLVQGARQGSPDPVCLSRPVLRKPLDLNCPCLCHGVYHDVCCLKVLPDGVGHG